MNKSKKPSTKLQRKAFAYSELPFMIKKDTKKLKRDISWPQKNYAKIVIDRLKKSKGKLSIIANVKTKLFYYAAFAFLIIFASYGLERLFGVPLWLNLVICLLVAEGMEKR